MKIQFECSPEEAKLIMNCLETMVRVTYVLEQFEACLVRGQFGEGPPEKKQEYERISAELNHWFQHEDIDQSLLHMLSDQVSELLPILRKRHDWDDR